MKPISLLLIATFALAFSGSLLAENQTVLLLENIGLKNTYRVVFQSWSEENHFATGILEVIPQEEDAPTANLRIPFRAEVKADPKNKGTEILEVSSIAIVSFFPPADKKDPYPHVIWKVTDRKGTNPTMKAKIWTFGKAAWTTGEMEFEKPKG